MSTGQITSICLHNRFFFHLLSQKRRAKGYGLSACSFYMYLGHALQITAYQGSYFVGIIFEMIPMYDRWLPQKIKGIATESIF